MVIWFNVSGCSLIICSGVMIVAFAYNNDSSRISGVNRVTLWFWCILIFSTSRVLITFSQLQILAAEKIAGAGCWNALLQAHNLCFHSWEIRKVKPLDLPANVYPEEDGSVFESAFESPPSVPEITSISNAGPLTNGEAPPYNLSSWATMSGGASPHWPHSPHAPIHVSGDLSQHIPIESCETPSEGTQNSANSASNGVSKRSS
mmetsp:Transcript_46205/g.104356  ORF Transcript_46205/g.104356 Transcript_46205/m.104356 type:complete len:204 (-) Transcript_46205:197-808(-)